jgi:hypothetical protein
MWLQLPLTSHGPVETELLITDSIKHMAVHMAESDAQLQTLIPIRNTKTSSSNNILQAVINRTAQTGCWPNRLDCTTACSSTCVDNQTDATSVHMARAHYHAAQAALAAARSGFQLPHMRKNNNMVFSCSLVYLQAFATVAAARSSRQV